MGEDDLDKRRPRKVAGKGRRRLHFERDQAARHLNLVLLEVTRFIYSERQTDETGISAATRGAGEASMNTSMLQT